MAFNKAQAQYPSYQEFLAFSKQQNNTPSYTNLFSVHFAAPRLMQSQPNNSIGGTSSNRLNPALGDLRTLLNYYANSVNLPSKQMTSGSYIPPGTSIKYITGTAYSQMNISFIMPRSQYLRSFFEEWTTKISPDSNQYVEFFDDYVCPSLTIFKWERDMGGDLARNDTALSGYLKDSKLPQNIAKKYRVTAVWEMRNAFPFNIGTIQLNNDTARAMTLTIGFFYERYRMLTEDAFSDPGTYQFPSSTPFTDNIPQFQRASSAVF